MPCIVNVGARSIFVTVTAWVFIVLAALTSASALVQNAAVASLVPAGAPNLPPLPLLSSLLIGYLPWVVGAGVVVSLATLAAAVGLLLRLEWARRAFIGLMVLAIVANLMGLWLQQEVVQSVVAGALSGAPLPPRAAGVFGNFVALSRVLAVLVTLGACSLLGWIIRRLMSPAVRQEFA